MRIAYVKSTLLALAAAWLLSATVATADSIDRSGVKESSAGVQCGTDPLLPVEHTIVMNHNDIVTVSGAPQATAANVDGPISTYTDVATRYWVMPSVEWFSVASPPWVSCPPGSGSGGQRVPNADYYVWHTTTTSGLQAGLDAPVGTSRTKKHQWEFFTNLEPGGRWWLVSTYKINEGEALGFVHVEHAQYQAGDTACPFFFGKGRIGVAYFKKGTNNDMWRYMGHVIFPFGDPTNMNIAGGPYIVKETTPDHHRYIWVYYNDSTGYGVAKTDLDILINAAQNNGPSPAWKKWNGEAADALWSSDAGTGGPFTGLPFANFPTTILHAGAGYSEYTHKYYLAATRQQNTATNTGTAILLYESCTGLDWTLRQTVEPIFDPTLKVGWQYTTMVDARFDHWPGLPFDREFYVYSGWEYYSNPPADPHEATWHRFKFTLGPGECFCPAPPGANGN